MKTNLSPKTVKEIKRLKKAKHLSIREIAKRCGVKLETAMQISGTKYERNWPLQNLELTECLAILPKIQNSKNPNFFQPPVG